MSQWVVLMVPEALDSKGLLGVFPEPLAQSVKITESGEILVPGDGFANITQIEELKPRHEMVADYGGNGLFRPSIRALLPNLRFFMARYRSWLAFRNFLQEFLEGWREDLGELWIDDDYGEIWKGTEFLQRLQIDPNWDWRQEKSWLISLVSREPIAFEELVEIVHAVEPEVAEFDKKHHELRWRDPRPDSKSGMLSTLYVIGTDPESQDDPILMDMLAEAFGNSVLGMSCLMLDFADIDFAKRILQMLIKGLGERLHNIRIDFDHGTVLSGKDTLEWLDLKPDWDWR